MSAAEIFVNETFGFIDRELAISGLRILEVGCGDGKLAAMMKKHGGVVTALDEDEEACLRAHGMGIEAVCTDFLVFDDGVYDAVIFTRSLHHIHRIGDALAHARKLMAAGGVVLAEEFALENVDRPTLDWYYEQRRIAGNPAETASDSTPDLLSSWHEEHVHDPPLHTGGKMVYEMKKTFGSIKTETAPYLFRSVFEKPSVVSANVANAVLTEEKRYIGENSILPVGLRMTARARQN